MDADEVQHGVIHARVNHDTPVHTVDDVHLAILLRKLCRARVRQGDIARDEEPKGTLARREGLNITAGNLGASTGLRETEVISEQSFQEGQLLEEAYAHAVSANNQMTLNRLSVLERHGCGVRVDVYDTT